jgi:hypothetical protein
MASEEEKKEVLRFVVEYMIAYLLEGFVDPNVTSGFDVEGAKALNFNTALKIRFLLESETKRFLEEVPTYLRRIRTEVSREKSLAKGEAKGHIDWSKTIQTWASSGFKDKTILNIDRSVKNYDIPENLILKKAITILSEFMNDNAVRKEIERTYDWSERLQEARRCVREVLKNVHFRRIMDASLIHISPRMKGQVKKSRKKLYRDSCRVFDKYERVFSRHELTQLLMDTFIDPRNIDKTFELFCLFTTIKVLEKMEWKVKKLAEIVRERNETAILTQGNFEIRIFYNVTGRLTFLDRAEPQKTKDALAESTQAFFGEKTADTTRRPDIIIELLCDGVSKDYAIFEVKNTREKEYIVQGMYQALHYLYDLKGIEEKHYFYGDTLGRGYNSAVIAFQLPKDTKKIEGLENGDLKVKLLDFSDLSQDSTHLRFFLGKFLEQNGVSRS